MRWPWRAGSAVPPDKPVPQPDCAGTQQLPLLAFKLRLLLLALALPSQATSPSGPRRSFWSASPGGGEDCPVEVVKWVAVNDIVVFLTAFSSNLLALEDCDPTCLDFPILLCEYKSTTKGGGTWNNGSEVFSADNTSGFSPLFSSANVAIE